MYAYCMYVCCIILFRSLSYEKSKTLFQVGHPPFHPVTHQIPLANRFKVPVVLYDVKLPSKAQEFFNVRMKILCIYDLKSVYVKFKPGQPPLTPDLDLY